MVALDAALVLLPTTKDGGSLMKSLAGWNAKPLVPGLVKGPDEEADESGLLRQLGANDWAGAG